MPISSKGLYRSDNGGYEDESSSLEDPTTVEELERRPKGVVVIRVGRPMFSSLLPDTHARQHSLAPPIVIQSDSELAQQPERTPRLTSLETETFHDSEAENRPPMNHFIPNHPIKQLRPLATLSSTLGQRTTKKRGHSFLVAHSIEPPGLSRRRSLAEIEVGKDWQVQRSKRQRLDSLLDSTSPAAGPASTALTRHPRSSLAEHYQPRPASRTDLFSPLSDAISELNLGHHKPLPAFARTRLRLGSLLLRAEAKNLDLGTHLTTALSENEDLHREIRELRR